MCIAISLTFPPPLLTIKVYHTTNDISEFSGDNSYIKLSNPPNKTMSDITLCLRFWHHRIAGRKINLLFSMERFSIFAGWARNKKILGIEWWQNDDLVTGATLYNYNYNNKTFYEFPDWPLNTWNHLCVTLNTQSRKLTIVLNTKSVLDVEFEMDTFKDYNLDNAGKHFLKNLMLMGACFGKFGCTYSMFGQITDVNIWDNVLTEEEIINWMTCLYSSGGNVINWEQESWTETGLEESTIEDQQVCSSNDNRTTMIIFPSKTFDFDSTAEYCRLLGGNIAVSNTRELSKSMFKLLHEEKYHCKNNMYSGHTDLFANRTFVDANTEQITWMDWDNNQPDNYGGKENCVMMLDSMIPTSIELHNGIMHDASCSNLYCPICKFSVSPQLYLRGYCSSTDIDSIYYLPLTSSKLDSPRKHIEGYKKTNIVWDAHRKTWRFMNLKTKTVVAFTNNTYNYPIGTHKWYFTNRRCTDNNVPWRKMTLHVHAQKGDFCCENGMYIKSRFRCDKLFDCRDKSDEKRCSLIVIPDDYEKQSPPSSDMILSERHLKDKYISKTDVNVLINVHDIYDINEVASTFIAQFEISSRWTDLRLQYSYLKENASLNVIDRSLIWTPTFQFTNLKKELSSFHGNTIIRRKGNTSIANSWNELLMEEFYPGIENVIEMVQLFQMELFCSYTGIRHYPFDKEVCTIGMLVQGTNSRFINIIPQVDYSGPKKFLQYSMDRWEVETVMTEGQLKLQVHVTLRRQAAMILLVTYLPTLLLNIINQCTNYLRSKENDQFGNIIKVNITCMVVLASIYISVFTKSPPSGEIKMIDVWLLVSFIYPFLVIIINMVMHFKLFKATRVTNRSAVATGNRIVVLDQPQSRRNEDIEDGPSIMGINMENTNDRHNFIDIPSTKSKLETIANLVIPLCYIVFVCAYIASATYIYVSA